MSQSFREYLVKAVKAPDAKHGEARHPFKMAKKHPMATGTKDGKCRCNCSEDETCKCHPLCKECGGAYTCRDSKKMGNAKKGWDAQFKDARKGAEDL